MTKQTFNILIGVLAVLVLAGAGYVVLDITSEDETGEPQVASSLNVDTEPVDDEIALPQDITPDQYTETFDTVDHLLLDVRTIEEFDEGHIEGASNIAVQELASRVDELPTDQPIVVYCRSGNRSAQAVDILEAAGYTNVYDMGGTNQWTDAGYELVQ